MNHPTRKTLISKVSDQNNEDAWEEFVSYYSEYLEKIFFKAGLNDEEVKDFTQNIFIKVWEIIPEFNYNPERGKFRSWITQIALNYISNYKRLKINNSEFVLIDEHIINQEKIEVDHTLELEWQSFIAEKAWLNIKETLSPKMQEAFELHLHGFSSKEIGTKLSIAESSARVYKKRINFKLKYEIERLEQELG